MKPLRPLSVAVALTALSLALAPHPLRAQIAIPAFGILYSENFDSIGTSATAALPTHWLMTAAGKSTVSWSDPTNVSATTHAASSGSPTSGGRYNWGQTASDRAVGFMTSGSYASPNSLLVHFANATGSLIDSLDLSFDYERYRLNSAAAAVTFFHSTDGSTWTAATAGDSGSLTTGASTYDFANLVSSNTRTVTLSALNLAPGASLYLRWNFSTNGANSQGLGLDNFGLTASAVPEPSTYAACAGIAALAGAIWHRRRRRAA
jgi:hypothetical protein